MPAEQLHLVDIGGLEADHGGGGHAEDRREKLPVKAAERNDIPEIERDADGAQHREVDDTDCARNHDRRVGAANFLIGDGKSGRSEPAAPFDRRAVDGGGRRGVEHLASCNRFHWSTSVLERALRNAPAGAEFPTPTAYGTNRKKRLRW